MRSWDEKKNKNFTLITRYYSVDTTSGQLRKIRPRRTTIARQLRRRIEFPRDTVHEQYTIRSLRFCNNQLPSDLTTDPRDNYYV